MESREKFRELAYPIPAGVLFRGEAESFPPLYRLLRAGAQSVFGRWFDLTVTGMEHLPPRGPYILAANHCNYLDGIVLGAVVPLRIAFLVMPRVYHATPLHPWLHRQAGSIPINLERPEPGAIKRALRLLEEGGVVGIFPEGPFSRNGQLAEGQPGVAMIALRSGAPVVPVAIHGTFEALAGRPLYLPRLHPLSVQFGTPLEFGRVRRGVTISRPLRETVTARIMAEIAALLARQGAAAGGTEKRGNGRDRA